MRQPLAESLREIEHQGKPMKAAVRRRPRIRIVVQRQSASPSAKAVWLLFMVWCALVTVVGIISLTDPKILVLQEITIILMMLAAYVLGFVFVFAEDRLSS